jgi:hypothetical protein
MICRFTLLWSLKPFGDKMKRRLQSPFYPKLVKTPGSILWKNIGKTKNSHKKFPKKRSKNFDFMMDKAFFR